MQSLKIHKKFIFNSFLLPLVVFFTSILVTPLFPQEGIIASCYYEEKNTLKKMWKAREAGDKEKVKELSNHLQNFVAEKKLWAQKLLEVTEKAIDEVEAQNSSGLSQEEIKNIKAQINDLEADIRLNNRIYEDCKLHYFRARQADSLEIDNLLKIIEDIKSYAAQKTSNLKNDIKWNENEIEGIKKYGKESIKNCQNDIEWNENEIEGIKKYGKESIKNCQNDIEWNENEIEGIKKYSKESIKNCQNDIEWYENDIENIKKYCKDRIKSLQNDINWNKDQIKQASNKDFVAEKKNKIASFKKEIEKIQNDLSTGEFSINSSSKSINDHKEKIKQLDEKIARITQGVGNGEFSINSSSKSINDHKEKIKQLDEEIARITQGVGNGEFSINSSSKSINDHKEKIKQLDEEIARITQGVGNGEFSINNSSKSINDHKEKIKQLNEEIARITKGIGNGEFSINNSSKSINDHKEKIKQLNEEIARITQGIGNGEFSINNSSKSINDHKEKIEAVKKAALKRKDEFTAEKWMNMKDIRRKIQAAELEIARLESMIGLKDEKLVKLNEDKRLLTKLLNHEFITSLPEKESGFIKAIKWCSNAIKEVNKAVSKYKKVKKVIDIIRSQDPLKAADTILKAATGQGLVDTVASKLLPEKVYKNKYVKKYLNGEFNTAKDALKDFADDQIPDDIKDKLETIKSLRENPEEFLKSKAYDKAMSVIEANPRLKNTLESFEKAKNFIENPETIELELKQNMEKYASEKFENNEAVQSLKNKMQEYEDRMEKIKHEKLRRAENYKKNVAAQVVKHLKNTVENRIGLKEIENSNFAENLVESYQFFTDPAPSTATGK
jgi:chromosome segregation ATPase